jgi:hypothetical protein
MLNTQTNPDKSAQPLVGIDAAGDESVAIARWFRETCCGMAAERTAAYYRQKKRRSILGSGSKQVPRVWLGGLDLDLNGSELPSGQVNGRTRRLEFGRDPHQVGEGIRFHFLHDLPAVCLHCDFADTELAANLFIQQPGND